MPAVLHTTLPHAKGHASERDFIERLVELGDARTQVWGNVDYLQGVGDLDMILFQPDIGVFTIEVKGVGLDMIESYGLKNCKITGRSGLHPVDQVSLATLDLRHYLGRFAGVQAPFFLMTAAFPRIARRAFVARFDDAQIIQHAESLIFAEDLESQTKLWRRLLVIREAPAKGRSAKNPLPRPDQLARFVDLIKPGPVVPPSLADQERGGVLRRQVLTPSTVSQKYLRPGTRAPIIFRGAPGTGKTVRLQEIAVAHARSGRAVLFTCYNRVLASYLRSVMASQNLGDEVHNRIVITHVDELRNQLSNDIDTFAGMFGTVCVDEGQDFAADSFEFVSTLAAPHAEWFIADGPGQELYGTANRTGESPAFLVQARTDGTIETLRRNFRNSRAGYLVAQAMYEASPDVSKISDWIARHPLRGDDDMLDLAGTQLSPGGDLPELIRIALPKGSDWKQAKLHAYVAIFSKALERLASEGKRRDLAVLCARGDSKSSEAQWAREAFAMLGVPVHDQIDGTPRDAAVPEDHVRLATIHSSRGVEASRVIILDYAGGVSAADDYLKNSRIMSHIALSRAQIGTAVVATYESSNPHLTFLEELLKAYRASGGGHSNNEVVPNV